MNTEPQPLFDARAQQLGTDATERPYISIVTVARNARAGLERTLASIRRQEGTCYEWVVVDGNSSDGTQAVLAACDLPLRWLSESDTGIYDAMNKGSALAHGDYVLFLNAGDTLPEPDTLGTVQSFLVARHETVDVLFGGATLMFPNGRRLYRRPREFAAYIGHGLPAIHQATYYRRATLSTLPYDASYRYCGDYFLAAKLFVKGATWALLNQSLVLFEIGGLSFMNPAGPLVEAARVQREVLHLPAAARIRSAARRLLNIVATHFLAHPLTRPFRRAGHHRPVV